MVSSAEEFKDLVLRTAEDDPNPHRVTYRLLDELEGDADALLIALRLALPSWVISYLKRPHVGRRRDLNERPVPVRPAPAVPATRAPFNRPPLPPAHKPVPAAAPPVASVPIPVFSSPEPALRHTPPVPLATPPVPLATPPVPLATPPVPLATPPVPVATAPPVRRTSSVHVDTEGNRRASSKTASLVDWYTETLRTSVKFGAHTRDWKPLAQCGTEDLAWMAAERRRQAAVNRAAAEKYEKLWKLLKDSPAAFRVEQLDRAIVEPILRG